MNFDDLITRRETLKRLITISGAVGFYGASGIPFTVFAPAQAEPASRRFIIEGIGQTEGYSIKELATRVFDAAGGMTRFVSKGDVVAIKPNISWARQPALAATTNPVVLEAVIELCYEAGAKKVRIVDNTINDARRCFAITGAGIVAKKTDADLVFPRSSLMRRMKINGDRLDVWPVFTPLIEADKVINLPIAKTHSLSSLTLGIKNWRRWRQEVCTPPGYTPDHCRPGSVLQTHGDLHRCHQYLGKARAFRRKRFRCGDKEYPNLE
jgi:hypothetical protein